MTWSRLAAASLDELLEWAEDQPWSIAMKQCGQDAGWHAEGDVWTHTKLVCSELTSLEGWNDLARRERTILLFTALFHDAAKPLTTQVDPATGRTTSPKHAVRGEHLAREVLRHLGCDLALREEIARMVRFHGRPAFLLEKTDPIQEVVRLSWLASNRLLYLFALADTRGRITAEMSRPEDNLHLWKMVAEEQNCFQQPYPFANSHARFLYFRREAGDLHYVPFERFACNVTMLSGLPGSGKDRWLTTNRPSAAVISLDDIRAELDKSPTDDQGQVIQAARERCRELLRGGVSFAFNATNLLRQTRTRWIDLFADYGARIEIVYIEPHFDVILKQNSQRDRAVPQDVLLRLAGKMEVPTMTECHHLTLVEG